MSTEEQLNITRIAEKYGVKRDTVRAKLRKAGIEPVNKVGNAPTYSIKEVEPLFIGRTPGAISAGYDPEELPPKDRKDWYQSENERLKFYQACKELIPAKDVRDTNVVMMKTLVAFFESLPDKMERSRLFNAEQLDLLEQQCDQFRAQLYNQLTTCYDQECMPQQ